MGIEFPDQGLNQAPILGVWSLSHWVTREVPAPAALMATFPRDTPHPQPRLSLPSEVILELSF